MKIVCVQFCPQLGKVQENSKHVQELVAGLKPEDVDLLVLPEMALTGTYGAVLT